jgi:flagellar hook-associated protein 2
MPIGDVTAGSIAGQVHFSGLGSGTDFDTLINKLVTVEQSRVKTYQTWKQSWLDKNVAFKDLNSKMLSLRTTLQGMDTIGEFLKKTAATTNSTTLTASAGGDAESGTHTFSVLQLAKNKMMVTSSGYATLTEDINTSASAVKFVYTYKGVTVSNAVPATATLTDLVNIINANADNNGVRASTIFDGSRYYLQVRGLDMGSNAALTVSGATTLANFGSANFRTTQANQDAKLKVDGWPLSNAYISRASNTISDVITGLTLSLKSSGAGTLTVDTDTNAVLENVRTFVNQVNTVRKQIRELTKYDSTTKQASILTGNYGLQIIGTILKNVTANQGTGFDTSIDDYVSLSPLGLTTDATQGSPTEGLILLDESKLKEALASNAYSVGKIFSAQFLGDTNSADIAYQSYISGITKAGTYAVRYTVAGGRITSATIGGHAATFSSNSALITGAAGYDEAGLVVKVNNLTDGTYSHNVNLRLGKTGELVNELTDLTNSDTGPLNILQKNYVTISDNIQKKIDYENKRISALERHMRDMYSRLDTLLGKYSQMQSQLNSQIVQLTSGK